MVRFLLSVLFVIAAQNAFAQLPQPQSPSQVALQIDTVVNQWAQALEAAQQTIKADQDTLKADQAKIADLQKQIDALKVTLPKEPTPKAN